MSKRCAISFVLSAEVEMSKGIFFNEVGFECTGRALYLSIDSL